MIHFQLEAIMNATGSASGLPLQHASNADDLLSVKNYGSIAIPQTPGAQERVGGSPPASTMGETAEGDQEGLGDGDIKDNDEETLRGICLQNARFRTSID